MVKKTLYSSLIICLLVFSVMPVVMAISNSSSITPGITVEQFEPKVWMCDSRVVLDDNTEPGRLVDPDSPLFATERNTIISAADRIIDLQNSDGSWDWVVTNQLGPSATTYLNIAGVNAEVLLDAYKLTGDSTYLNAAKKTGDYLITQFGNPVDITKRYDAFNILFLYHLYDATGDVQYKNEADAIMGNVINEKNYFTNNNGNFCTISGCSASQLVSAIKNRRGATVTPSGIVVWDLYNFIEDANRAGYHSFANNIANEINSYLNQPGYVSSIDYYELGLSTGILGLAEAGKSYSSDLSDLLANQNIDGSFETPGSIQTTAYALMALRVGNELAAASNAASYLESNFGYAGLDGWLENDGEEYSESTSEAAQALFDYIREDETLFERINNYAFEGEQIEWTVLVMDKNKIDQNIDVYATLDGNIEVNCQRIGCDSNINIDSCNARIDEERITACDTDTMSYFRCLFTVETPESMYGEYWLTVEAEDGDGLTGTMAENEYWFLNPVIALSIDNDMTFEDVRPGTDSYSTTMRVGNDADDSSGVLMDMFISGTDFYDLSSSGARCPSTNQLGLGAFRYYATNGAYNSAQDLDTDLVDSDRDTDSEGYTNIDYGIGFNDPNPFYDNMEILQAQKVGPYYTANLLAPGAEMSITFKLSLPEPCNGDFDSGSIYFWGEAI